MRILYIMQYFVPPDGAWSTRSYEFAKELVKNGHEVRVLTSSGMLPAQYQAKEKTRDISIDDIPVTVLPVAWANEMSYLERIRALVMFAYRASRHAIQHKVDVVFVSSPPLTIVFPAILAKLRYRVPMVFEVRDLWPEGPIALGALTNPLMCFLAEHLVDLTYYLSAHIIALAPSAADVIKNRGVNAERISVIPNISDLELFGSSTELPTNKFRHELGLTADQPLVTYVGTLGFMHGVDYLVNVAAEMKQIAPDVRFLLVGNGKTEEQIRQQAQDRGVLDQNLFMRDKVIKKDVPNVLREATLCVSTMRPVKAMEHNSANKFFDALAAGKPLALNYGGWQAELITEHKAGVVMPSTDPKQGAQILAEFIHDQERLAHAAKMSRQLAENNFSRDEAARKVVSILENVVKAKTK